MSFGADYILGTVVTDENGEFYGTWNAEMRAGGGSYDFYAVFEGSSNIAYTRSQTYSVYVDSHTSTPTPAPTPVPTPAPIPTILKLNSLPKSMISLVLPDEKELYPEVIFFKPNLDKIFSKGKNSPNGTRFILLYNDKISKF